MDTIVALTMLYLGLGGALTACMSQLLYQNGARLLNDVFRGREEMADPLAELVAVEFCLVGMAIVCLGVRLPDTSTVRHIDCLELLANRIGVVMLALAAVYGVTLCVLRRIRPVGAPGEHRRGRRAGAVRRRRRLGRACRERRARVMLALRRYLFAGG